MNKTYSTMCRMASGHIKKGDVGSYRLVGRMTSTSEGRRDALLFLHSEFDTRVIAFPGASGSNDWTKLLTRPLGVFQGLVVHAGVAELLQTYSVSDVVGFSDYSLANKLSALAAPFSLPAGWKNVVFTGFSLGGALATLLSAVTTSTWDGTVQPLKYRGRAIVGNPAVSFGNPPVIHSTMDSIDDIRSRVIHYVSTWSLATDVAHFAWASYSHVGLVHKVEIRQIGDQMKKILCNTARQILSTTKVSAVNRKVLEWIACGAGAATAEYVHVRLRDVLGELGIVGDFTVGIYIHNINLYHKAMGEDPAQLTFSQDT
jgi:hypothetical protein